MLEIQVKKPPITKIKISDDLTEIFVYLDINLINAKMINLDEKLTFLLLLMNPDKYTKIMFGTAGESFASKPQHFIIHMWNFGDNVIRQKKLNLIFSDKKTLGDVTFQHSIQQPLQSLFRNGFIEKSQMKEVSTFVEEKLSALRELDRIEQRRNEGVLIDILAILSARSPSLDTCPCPSVKRTLAILSKIFTEGGDLRLAGPDLLCILLNEGAIDDFLQVLDDEFDSKAELKCALLNFQAQVKQFTEKYSKEITTIIEQSLPHVDSGYKMLYEQYKAKQPHLPRRFYNLGALGCIMFYQSNEQARTEIRHKATLGLSGLVVSDEEMAASAFGRRRKVMGKA